MYFHISTHTDKHRKPIQHKRGKFYIPFKDTINNYTEMAYSKKYT